MLALRGSGGETNLVIGNILSFNHLKECEREKKNYGMWFQDVLCGCGEGNGDGEQEMEKRGCEEAAHLGHWVRFETRRR